MRVYLIGYMGSGKTRFGSELSATTGYPFIDIDEIFEAKYRISIVDFFDKYNEATFRKLERDLLLDTINYIDAVISTGGGTPCFYDNMDFIKKNGISIYLKMEIQSLVNRLAIVKKKRPLLKDKSLTDMEPYIRAQIVEREIFYNQADFTVDAEVVTVNDVVRLISTSSA